MRDEFVRRRGWLDDPTFLDLLGAANLIPGPTSTELAMHIGYRRAGRVGLVVGGLAFLLPAVVIVAILAWLYVEFGRRPEIEALFVGVGPVVVAVIAHAGWSIARGALRAPWHAGLLAAAIVAILAGVPEIAVLLLAGVVGLVVGGGFRTGIAGAAAVSFLPAPVDAPASAPAAGAAAAVVAASVSAPAVVAASVSAPAILFAFLKIGAVLFGSGYVLVALLRSELVDGLGWLTEAQLLDAVAIGQATPGPLFTTSTFIGYVIGGPVGMVAATVGVFLPAFIAVGLSVPIIHRLRGSVRARAFLDGVNVAAVGLIAVVAVQLAFGAVRDVLALGEAVVALTLLAAGVGSGRLVLAGAAIGLIRLALVPR
jgi:chromate transporter